MSLRILSIAVTSMIAMSCSSSSDAPVPQGLTFSVQTDTHVEGSFAQGADWIRFTSTAHDVEHSDIEISGATGIVMRSSDRRFVQLGTVELLNLDEAGVAAAEPAMAVFFASTEAELASMMFRRIDTGTADLGPALGALYAASSALETGISGQPLTVEPPKEARACWNKCCGTDCDCYHYNPCSWWDPTCNYCANHDACIHYYRDHLGWSNVAATAWCT